ncbi:MAG: shikimate dehydrogenase [Betaproteobacteria bacterium HGW-Betaproteobacteria-7]|jgi:shikimate dehydrogenase|nr:MAG: shikimate dehydrogenase [Betaproteobacteria bacterium HGW-Betaproteobacteria-7]
MSDMYCVFGNPVGHSRSPAIHSAFAAASGEDLCYEARLAPVDGFAGAVAEFVAAGGKGANVTVPFKEEACRLSDRLSGRAARAGAVNTLVFRADGIFGDNTDGAGLVQDIKINLGFALSGRRILLLGAGGAARGVIAPLLAESPASLHIANRSAEKARLLAQAFSDMAPVSGGSFNELAGKSFDLVINATSASLAGESLPLPAGLFAPGTLAYDMMYGKGQTPFLQLARAQGAAQGADGLGMLVEQAAEAFFVWRGVRPATAAVLAALRRQIST